MKSNAHPSFYFSPHSLKGLKHGSSVKTKKSPYLKAVLSGKARPADHSKASFGENSLAAALRYIANSK